MSRFDLDLRSAEQFVARNTPVAGRKPRPTAYWDGWTMVLVSPTEHGFSNPAGVFVRDGGYWGMAKRVQPNAKGRYEFTHKGAR